MHPFSAIIKRFGATSKTSVCIPFSRSKASVENIPRAHTNTDRRTLQTLGGQIILLKNKNLSGINNQGFRQIGARRAEHEAGAFLVLVQFSITVLRYSTFTSMSTAFLFLLLYFKAGAPDFYK